MRGRRAADGNGSPAAAADEWPTSVRTEIMSRVTDYQFWISQTVSYFHPLGVYQHLLPPIRYFHGYNDPTAFHVPVLWDNRERPLFTSSRSKSSASRIAAHLTFGASRDVPLMAEAGLGRQQ
jgi:hypothetical protein